MPFEPPDGTAYTRYEPDDEGRREVLLALGNGRLSLRGTACWAEADETHYPGTYLAGLYNRLPDLIEGEPVNNESLVNLPNGLLLNFRVEGERRWFAPEAVQILRYRHALDGGTGITRREVLFEDGEGRRTALTEDRLVSMAQPHLAALRLEIAPQNWSGRLEVRAAIEGDVINGSVNCLRPFASRHLEAVSPEARNGLLLVSARTRTSRIVVAVAARTRIHGAAEQAWPVTATACRIAETLHVPAGPGAPAVVEKTLCVHSGGDAAARALAELRDAPGFAALRDAHGAAWAPLRQRIGVEAEPADLGCALRLGTVRILQTVSPHSRHRDVGFPSRGWQEAYRGQIFWDETLVLPFLATRLPELARQLLDYRRARLPDAKRNAEEAGLRGALYPWRSASDGGEHTPRFQWNPLSRRFMPDHTRLQRHIGAAVALNVWHYAMTTGDDDFLFGDGAEMILEIARCFNSLARRDEATGRYSIAGVVGPDEFHVQYPGAPEPGLRDNAYTNVMAAWTLGCALRLLDRLPPQRAAALRAALALDEAELRRWDAVSRRLRLVFDAGGVLLPFDGFDRLEPFDAEAFEAEHPGERPDLGLEKSGDSINRYQRTKQADTLMLRYLLSHGALEQVLERLGYPMDAAQWRRTAQHDLARMSHDSSLSELVCAAALAPLDPAASWSAFSRTLRAEHNPSGPTASSDGAHLGSLGGALDVLQRHYLGFGLDWDRILLNPAPPAELGPVRLALRCRFGRFTLDWGGEGVLRLRSDGGNAGPVPVVHASGTTLLPPGGEVAVAVAGLEAAAE
ncbi:glycoside hydrolase family 65 protein [Teichococcus vastitatis]|uniref:Glycoside hydrolase family 65 protein n=1 Tax=Teichococcus vastitatis TaxID=2307076 RepID=A0ABS9VZ74_9PROT|nr:glycoside hydrolase family 65 protein [Pseudoroseomonas vastitatis]MCI0752301.1 glycoside hydrolase family 65 protein [Pseudoroseomonas vastitatis]